MISKEHTIYTLVSIFLLFLLFEGIQSTTPFSITKFAQLFVSDIREGLQDTDSSKHVEIPTLPLQINNRKGKLKFVLDRNTPTLMKGLIDLENKLYIIEIILGKELKIPKSLILALAVNKLDKCPKCECPRQDCSICPKPQCDPPPVRKCPACTQCSANTLHGDNFKLEQVGDTNQFVVVK